MTHSKIRLAAVTFLVAAAALVPVLASGDANARGGKEYFEQEYLFDQPMAGKEGFQGAYFCSYKTTPIVITLPNGQKVKKWKLTQSCQ